MKFGTRPRLLCAAMVLGLAVAFPAANAALVTNFAAAPAAAGVWGASSSSGGSAGVVGLVGAGGNLENNQAAPANGAARLVAADNTSRADITLNNNFGLVRNVLPTLQLDYSFYRETVSGSNISAAPTLKLSFFNAAVVGTGVNRGFTQLIYEPYWQPAGVVNNPVSNDWVDVSIDIDTGLFWSTNGFGQASGAGGPPLRTLQDWMSTFAATFLDATMTTVGFGLGNNNGGVTGYVDSVRINSANFDFGTAAPVSAPGTLGLALAGVFILGALRGRKDAARA